MPSAAISNLCLRTSAEQTNLGGIDLDKLLDMSNQDCLIVSLMIPLVKLQWIELGGALEPSQVQDATHQGYVASFRQLLVGRNPGTLVDHKK